MSYKFRVAEPADAVAFAQIIHEWGAETPWMCRLDHPKPMADYWEGGIKTQKAWVAVHTGDVVGFCLREIEDNNIAGLYVARAARNHGVGKRLLDLAKAEPDWIKVWAYEKNTRARAFYAREGLVEVSRETETYPDGVSLVDVEHRWTRHSDAK